MWGRKRSHKPADCKINCCGWNKISFMIHVFLDINAVKWKYSFFTFIFVFSILFLLIFVFSIYIDCQSPIQLTNKLGKVYRDKWEILKLIISVSDPHAPRPTCSEDRLWRPRQRVGRWTTSCCPSPCSAQSSSCPLTPSPRGYSMFNAVLHGYKRNTSFSGHL